MYTPVFKGQKTRHDTQITVGGERKTDRAGSVMSLNEQEYSEIS